MPKNPWIHKSRKRRRKRKKSPEAAELNSRLPSSSDMDIRMGTLSSEILPVPLNHMKKEIIYPDTRFQRSTTLFPAIAEDNSEIPRKILKRDPEELPKETGQDAERIEKALPDPSIEVMSEIPLPSDNLQKCEDTVYPDSKFQRSSTLFPTQGIENIVPSKKHSETSRRDPENEESVSGQEVELIEYYKMPDPSISIDVMSEIPLPNGNPLKYEGTIYPDTKFQRSSTLFPTQGIENIVPSEKHSVTSKCDPEDEESVAGQVELIEYYKMPDPSISIDVIPEIPLPNDNLLKYEETSYPNTRFQRTTTVFPAEEVEIIPSEKPDEALLLNDDFETMPEKVKMNDLSSSDYCIAIRNSNSLDEVEEIDLTDGSQGGMSQLKTLEVKSIPSEKPTETLSVNDAFEATPEKVKMNYLSNSDYCVIIGNSNSQDEVDEIDLTDGSHRVLSRVITLD